MVCASLNAKSRNSGRVTDAKRRAETFRSVGVWYYRKGKGPQQWILCCVVRVKDVEGKRREQLMKKYKLTGSATGFWFQLGLHS